MGSNRDYWWSFRIKISHRDTYTRKHYNYLEAPDNFNVYVNLFLLLTMSALEC